MPDSVNLNFSVTSDMTREFRKALKEMQAKEVFAGFPEGEDEERKDEDGNPVPITNAALAYVHNTGSPEQNIPARPFMVEGIDLKREEIASGMEDVGIAALDGNVEAVDRGLHTVGTIARDGIKSKILDGPFEPLADSTIERYAAQGIKGAQAELDSRSAGNDPNPENVRPLNRTGQMRNAVNYAVREK